MDRCYRLGNIVSIHDHIIINHTYYYAHINLFIGIRHLIYWGELKVRARPRYSQEIIKENQRSLRSDGRQYSLHRYFTNDWHLILILYIY